VGEGVCVCVGKGVYVCECVCVCACVCEGVCMLRKTTVILLFFSVVFLAFFLSSQSQCQPRGVSARCRQSQ
jgi:hypothetical protein